MPSNYFYLNVIWILKHLICQIIEWHAVPNRVRLKECNHGVELCIFKFFSDNSICEGSLSRCLCRFSEQRLTLQRFFIVATEKDLWYTT